MNIWYFSTYDQPLGASSRTFDYAAEFAKNGCKVTAFTNVFCHYTKTNVRNFKGLTHHETNNGVNIVWIKNIPYYKNDYRRFLNMIICLLNITLSSLLLGFKSKPNLIIAPSVPIPLALAGLVLARLFRSKFVFEVRDVWPQTLVDLGILSKNSFAYKILRLIEKFLYRNSDMISVVLPGAIDHISKSGVTKKKVFWHPNGVDLKKYSNFQHVCNEDKKNFFNVTYVGGFANTHDVENIVHAAKILHTARVDNVFFEIYGDGITKKYVQSIARDLKLTNIKFYGAIPKSEVFKVLHSADVLVACVKATPAYQFGINSNKLLDYLATGIPVIFCGNVKNNPIESSRCGFSIPASDPELLAKKILEVKNFSDDKKDEIKKESIRFVIENYTMSRLGINYLNNINKELFHGRA